LSAIRKLIDERYREIVVITALAAALILLTMAALSMGKAESYMVNVDIRISNIDAVYAVVFIDGWHVFDAAVNNGAVAFEGRVPFDANIARHEHMMSMTFIHADGTVTSNAVTIDASKQTPSGGSLVIDISM